MDLFRRHPNNPILTVNQLPVPAIAVYNPGVAEVNGEVVLLLRVELADGRSSLYVAKSKDGVNDWEISDTPLLAPDDPNNPIAE
ncbi:MAG: glycosidase, partial [Armatimonadota bacterium]